MEKKPVKQQKKGKLEKFVEDNKNTLEIGVTILVGVGKLGIELYKTQRKLGIYEEQMAKAGMKLFRA